MASFLLSSSDQLLLQIKKYFYKTSYLSEVNGTEPSLSVVVPCLLSKANPRLFETSPNFATKWQHGLG